MQLSVFCKPAAIRYIWFSYKRFYMRLLTCFLMVIVLIFSINANAQFSKGTRMAGATIGSAFYSAGNSDQAVTSIGSTTAKTNTYNLNITPALAWFLSKNIAAGASINIISSGNKVSFAENGSTFQHDHSNNFNIGIGGTVRNYLKSSGTWLPFGQLGIDGGISNVKQDGFFYGGSGPTAYKETYDGKSSGGFYLDASFIAGLTRMVSQYTGIDVFIGYNFSYARNIMRTTRLRDDKIDGIIDETAKNETTSKITNHKIIFGLGFQVFLEKRKKK